MENHVKFEGVSEDLQKILDADMDRVGPRRRAREAFKDIQSSIDHVLFKMPCDGLKITESYEVNSRGLEIFSKSWLPESGSVKAVVCFCHCYGDTCTFFIEGKPEFQMLPSFLFGISMGGVTALKVHLKQPDSWNGAVLVAPMCKIPDDMILPWLVTQILMGVAKLLPKSKLAPRQDFAEMAFKVVKKREQASYNVIAYKDRPRLGTAMELLRTTIEIEQLLEKVSLSLLILHGMEDKVTDPSVSKALYEKASSSDKKLNLYEDAYHALLEGETDEMILRVLGDIISWLDERC